MADRNEFKFKILNVSRLVDFLKKMGAVEQNLLVELDVNDMVISKTFDKDRTVVKRIDYDFSTIFEYQGDDDVKQRINIGLYNLPKFISLLGFLNDNSEMILLRNEVKKSNKKKDDTTSNTSIEIDRIVLNSNKIKFEVDCAAKNLFTYLSDDKFEQITDIDSYKVKFDFKLDERKNIFNLMSVDDSAEILTITYKNENIVFSGKGWEYKAELNELSSKESDEFKIMVKKKNIRCLDNEEYEAYIMDEHLVLKSKESTNIILVGAVLEDLG